MSLTPRSLNLGASLAASLNSCSTKGQIESGVFCCVTWDVVSAYGGANRSEAVQSRLISIANKWLQQQTELTQRDARKELPMNLRSIRGIERLLE